MSGLGVRFSDNSVCPSEPSETLDTTENPGLASTAVTSPLGFLHWVWCCSLKFFCLKCWLPFDIHSNYLLRHMHLQHSDSALCSGKGFSIFFLPIGCVLFAPGHLWNASAFSVSCLVSLHFPCVPSVGSSQSPVSRILFMLHWFCVCVSVLFLSCTVGSGLDLLRSQE